MKKGQATLELLIGYSLAIAVIAVIIALIFLLFPSLFGKSSAASYSGFQGLRIIGQGYDSSTSLFFIKFQNLLNENMNFTKIYMSVGGINYTSFSCTSDYIPALEYGECNLTASLKTGFSGSVYIYYTPANTSISTNIAIEGNVVN